MDTRIGELSVSYSARGNPTYSIDLWHDGLNKHRTIRGSDSEIIKLKATLQIQEWADRWGMITERAQQRDLRADGRRQHEERKAQAIERTDEAQAELNRLTQLLKATLAVDE